jgi:hypothetical protein
MSGSEAETAPARRTRIALLTVAEEDAFHHARVLLLIDAFTGRTRGLGDIDRLTRLDYVLRFPWLLARLPLEPHRAWPAALEPPVQEVKAFDAQYAAARYGPWFDRYQRMAAVLEAKGLLEAGSRSTEALRTTRTGRLAVRQLITDQSWARHYDRAGFLRAHVNLSARTLDLAIRTALGSAPRRDTHDASATPPGLA